MISLLTFFILTCIPMANADSYLVATAVVRFDSGDEEYAVYSALLNEGYVKGALSFEHGVGVAPQHDSPEEGVAKVRFPS